MDGFPLAPDEVRTLTGEDAQRALGASLAAALPPGSVLFLEGELGAGKTTLTQGLVAALGFTDTVTSPTYALMHVYPTPAGNVLHVDARLPPQELHQHLPRAAVSGRAVGDRPGARFRERDEALHVTRRQRRVHAQDRG